jgi:hypothetical protein
MKRFLLLPVLVGCAALVALAEDPSARPDPADRVPQLKRNRPLVKQLIESGLQLAAEERPLQRAECCNRLARHLAEEIEEAAKNKDKDRARELGAHFKSVLWNGVAPNLSTVREQSAPGSALEPELQKVGAEAAGFVKHLEMQLQQTEATEREGLEPVLQAVLDGGRKVELAVQPTAAPSRPAADR